MPDIDKTQEFVEKLKPCIEKGELDACVDEAVKLAEEMGISANDLLGLSTQVGRAGIYVLAYVIAGAAAQGLEGKEMAVAHNNIGLASYHLGNIEKTEQQYKRAIEIDPKNTAVHSNYANLLKELKRQDEAKELYKQAIEIDPKNATAHYNYAILLQELKRHDESEEQYKLAIEADPKYAAARSNYAILLQELKRHDEAEKQYKLAIEADPKHAARHSNYANLLKKLKRHDEAEKQYKLAIEADPKLAESHGAYGLLFVELDRKDKAQDETKKASDLFRESGRITNSHLAWAWLYERYSEKYFKQRKFHESGEDAGNAGDEYLKAAETTEGALKDNFSQQGNILKAKSFVRIVPKKKWHRNIPLIGKKTDISKIINNLKEAASYYEKASTCPVDEKQDVCNACHTSISVFSYTLSAMDALLNKRSAEINKKEWDKSLESARLIYEEKEMKNGVALVDTLKQLIKCVDEIAVHKENGLGFQKDKCGKCFDKLADVSENLDGALNVLAEHSIEAIRDYAKKQGMGGFGEIKPEESKLKYWVYGAIGVFATVVIGYLTDQLFEWKAHELIIDFIKNKFNLTQP